MIFVPSPEFSEHLQELGVKQKHFDLDDVEYEQRHQRFRQWHPEETAEQIDERVAFNMIWDKHKPEEKTDPQHEELVGEVRAMKRATIIGFIALTLLLLLFAGRAHAQIDVIQFQDNTGAIVGTFAAPFKIKAGSNCTPSRSGSILTFNCSGGAAAAGGTNGQLQFNNSSALGGITSFTSDGTSQIAQVGTKWTFADPTTPTKKFQFDASNISAATTRIVNIPNANSTLAQAISVVAHQYLTGMSAQGLFSQAQPAYSDLTGTPTLPATLANSAHKWFNSYDSVTGLFSQTQPDFSDLTGTATKGQIPAVTVYTDAANSYATANIQKFRDGTNFEIGNDADITKLIKFDNSGITTGTTRTIKPPDANSSPVADTDCTGIGHVKKIAAGIITCSADSGGGGSSIVCSQTSIQGGDTLTAAGSFATTCTITASTMAVGDVYDLWGAGTNANSGTGSNWSYGIKFGTTTVLSGGNIFENASVSGAWDLLAKVTVITTGATGTIEAQGLFNSTTTAGLLSPKSLFNTAVITIDTTANQVITFTEVATPGGTSPTTTMRQSVVRKN
jgi:hypothetical protein